MRFKSPYYQIADFLSSQSYKHRSSQGDDSSHHHRQSQQIPRLIRNRWKIHLPLSSGSFGEIYQGENLLTNEKVAIKFQLKTSSHCQLAKESRIYRSIEGFGMPKMYWYALINSEKKASIPILLRYGTVDGYHAMVLEMLGPSIEDLYNYCQRKFSMKTVLLLAEQMLERICHLHRRCVIHRDIKPDNFTMGINSKSDQVYLIDFGLSKFYLNPQTRQHIEYRDKKHFLGTLRYASLRTHAGIEQSRRDDLESLAYSLIYLARKGKCLPWQGIHGQTKRSKQEKIYEMKLQTTVDVLCRNLPKEFEEFLIYTRQLGFAEEPNYVHLLKLIQQIYQTKNIRNDFLFDWIVEKRVSKDT